MMRYPAGYWGLSQAERAAMCNGMGPRGFGALIPESIYGLSITRAANIHDVAYAIGTTRAERLMADQDFLANVRSIIETHTRSALLRRLRRARAQWYYWTLRAVGGWAYARRGRK